MKTLVSKATDPASLRVSSPARRWVWVECGIIALVAIHTPVSFAQKDAAKAEASKPTAAAASSPAAKSKRLPDEGLKRAQQAEKFLKENQPQQAIITLTQLDKDFPGHTAVSLRLAQVFDQMDQSGPALFYYRRYVSLAGEKAMQEANERLHGLELMPQARKGAVEFAEKRGEKTHPVQTPPPLLQHQVAVERKDGALIPVRTTEELAALKSGRYPDATPVQLKPAASPLALSLNIPQTAKTEPPTAPASSPAPAPAKPVLSPLPVDVSTQGAPSAAPTASPVRTPVPRPQRTSSVYADATPSSPDADEQLAAAFARGASSGSSTPLPTEQATEPGPDNAAAGASLPISTPVVSISGINNPPSAQSFPSSPAPAPARPEPTSYRATTFFSVKPDSSGRTTLRLANGLPDAVVTFAAVPENDGQTVNAILTKGESRNVQVAPGEYEITINVSTTTYPPITQLDTSFSMRFEAGKQYSRRFTRDTVEHVR